MAKVSAIRSVPEPTTKKFAHSTYVIQDRAVLVCDVINSTSLCIAESDIDSYLYLRCYLDRMCRAVRDCDGVVTKTLGDGLEATFVGRVDALTCALRIANLRDRSTSGQVLGVRVGLTYGSLIEYAIDDCIDYFGKDVILASRMSKYGTDPGVIMSSTFAENPVVAGRLHGYAVDSIGVTFKGLSNPVVVYRLRMSGSQQTRPGDQTDRSSGSEYECSYDLANSTTNVNC